ncbi:MAG TPA: alpha/beta hydrolase [Acidocella sp.]|jgi:pimeloyl-ACP methyl ester carboxylesterase|nr:alpha/beta hydrolase [Acidocella sp.]
MSKIILIHGAWHGADCWAKLIPLLRARGHEVLAPDLPGMGADKTPLARLSMADWVASVAAHIRATPGPAVLVGHSRGGMVISAVAEAAPELVSRLIYVAAFVPSDGQSLLGITQAHGGEPVPIVVDQQARSCLLGELDPVELFYQDCSEEDTANALAGLCPEPLFGLMGPVKLSAARFGSVPKDYVECLADRAISLERQRQMQLVWPVQRVRGIATGHSPFLSRPKELAEILSELAG